MYWVGVGMYLVSIIVSTLVIYYTSSYTKSFQQSCYVIVMHVEFSI